MGAARDAPDPIAHWIVLLDAAERMVASAPCAPGALVAADAAFAVLLAHEHALPPEQRYQARLTLWQRNHAGEQLPDRHVQWGECTCPACHRARLRARVERREAVWQAQLRILQQQKQRLQRKDQHTHD